MSSTGGLRIDSCELFFLKIPLRVSFSHAARIDRTFSDSVIVRIGSAGIDGCGEAVVRDYVSGSLGAGQDYQREAARLVSRLILPFAHRPLGWKDILASIHGAACEGRDLPFVCALETALMDLACRTTAQDVYELLERQPRRNVIAYGGVLPMLPQKEAERFLAYSVQLGLPNMKLKVNGDPDFTSWILALSRRVLGESFDIRVDANSSWTPGDDGRLFEACRRFGVTIVEQPFDDSAPGAADALRAARARGFQVMADERVLTSRDIRMLAEEGTYTAVNLRLSKNGGLSRVLDLAGQAQRSGLSYQLGCMVGETGILSALGRAAAALLPDPQYFEGSYDDALLTENITTQSMGFGRRGEAPVIRGQGVGFTVSPEKLARLSAARISCL